MDVVIQTDTFDDHHIVQEKARLLTHGTTFNAAAAATVNAASSSADDGEEEEGGGLGRRSTSSRTPTGGLSGLGPGVAPLVALASGATSQPPPGATKIGIQVRAHTTHTRARK